MSTLFAAAGVIAAVVGFCALVVMAAEYEAKARARHRADKWAA